MRLLFADCVLDADALELRRQGQPVPLSPRGMRLLVMLLERRPRPVSQRELRDALWPQTHVGYTSLAQVVTEVRKAIGDQPGGEGLIRTVPRIGYAFAATVADESADGPPGALAPARPALPAGADESADARGASPPAGNGGAVAGFPSVGRR